MGGLSERWSQSSFSRFPPSQARHRVCGHTSPTGVGDVCASVSVGTHLRPALAMCECPCLWAGTHLRPALAMCPGMSSELPPPPPCRLPHPDVDPYNFKKIIIYQSRLFIRHICRSTEKVGPFLDIIGYIAMTRSMTLYGQDQFLEIITEFILNPHWTELLLNHIRINHPNPRSYATPIIRVLSTIKVKHLTNLTLIQLSSVTKILGSTKNGPVATDQFDVEDLSKVLIISLYLCFIISVYRPLKNRIPWLLINSMLKISLRY